MSLQFDQKYAAEIIKELTVQTWRSVIGDLDARVADMETLRPDLEESIETLTGVALARINDILTPAISKILQYTSFGFLMANSATPLTLQAGNAYQFVVNAGTERELFVPSPFCTISRKANHTDYAYVRTSNYNRDTGVYLCEVISVSSAFGLQSDWVISSGTGVSLAVQNAVTAVNAAAATATANAANSTANAAATASDRAATAADKISTNNSATVATTQASIATTKAAEAAASAASISGGPVISVDGLTGVVKLAKLTTKGDETYTIVGTPANSRDKVVALAAALTAPRIWTLPAANTVPAGFAMHILDAIGGISVTNTLTIQRTSTDTINGASSYTLKHAYADLVLVSDGASKWTYDVAGVGRGGTGATNEAAARIKLGIEGRSTLGDVASVVPATAMVSLSIALTAPRVWTLPAANSVNPGQGILISDEVAGISATNTLTLAPAGTDTINGVSSLVLKTPRTLAYLVSNGVDRWLYDLSVASTVDVIALSTTAANNTQAITDLTAATNAALVASRLFNSRNFV